MIEVELLSRSVKLAIIFSGVFLWIGMLTGVWKYYQISRSHHSRAHYYVDIAHRSSLLYAPATLIIAVLAYFSAWNDLINLICVSVNIFFFAFAIASYVLHGMLKDTSNQFKKPHQLGAFHLHPTLMFIAMLSLIVGELAFTLILLIGVVLNFI